MIGPRTQRQRQRYLRHKVIAILATFALGYAAVKLFVPRDHEAFQSLEALVLRTPEKAFRERATGEMVHAVAIVEAVPGDSSDVWHLRTLEGHPFDAIHEGAVPLAVGDTVVVRGAYEWTLQGGAVDTKGTGPRSEGGTRPGFLRGRSGGD
jgi:hypothetical protein